jgi:hypothetical protein
MSDPATSVHPTAGCHIFALCICNVNGNCSPQHAASQIISISMHQHARLKLAKKTWTLTFQKRLTKIACPRGASWAYSVSHRLMRAVAVAAISFAYPCNALLLPSNFASSIRSGACNAQVAKAQQHEQQSLVKQLTKALLPAALSVALCFGTALQPVHALNEQQQVVAEVWRTVDRLYLDRTFNKVDWFDLRQQTIKAAAAPMSESELNKVLAHYTSLSLSTSLLDRYVVIDNDAQSLARSPQR